MTSMDTDFDIAICGAGPVGLALAALLVKRGATAERIVLIDAKTVEQAAQDPRSIALSHGSRQILEQIDAWPQAVTPIHQIHVSRRGHFGRTLIDREEYRLPALGYVVRYGTLVSALVASIGQQTILRPATVTSVIQHDEMVELHLADDRHFTSRVVVQAEGGVFAEQANKTLRKEYDQTAIVAHVEASAPLPHRAFERFTDEGPLALLPQDSGYALVWCVRPATAERLHSLTDQAFLVELGHAFGNRMGRFTAASQRNRYPLGLNVHPVPAARIVAIGNAAQTLHPVAGQGLNLGLRDAMALARLLAKNISPATLTQFAELRNPDRNLAIRITDTLARLFSDAPGGAISQSLLGLSLGITDVLAPAKRILAEQMMFGQR